MLLAATAGGVWIGAAVLSRRFEPYIRQQAIDYLRKRFDSDVDLFALHIRLPKTSPLRLILARGRGGVARVEGDGLALRHKQMPEAPPIFLIKHFTFDVDLGKLFDGEKSIAVVKLDGVDIRVPPKRDRPKRAASSGQQAVPVRIEKLILTNARLTILPKDPKKVPLQVQIRKMEMNSVASTTAMKYDAVLTIPKPPGEISSQGSFGPWVAEEPGDTPLSGTYTFRDADLGIFAGIAGILNSTGKFAGTLDAVEANGEARVPDFRLKMAGNRVPLTTRFQVLVDGTNGNTVLQPVQATLGSTSFTTSGSVIKHEGDLRRAIALDVHMPRGDVQDLLRLATKGAPFMEGKILLNARIAIPPLTGKVREKLLLDGRFEISDSKFLRSTIQDQIDSLSRRGQGAPTNEEIDEVVSYMDGEFHLENQVITFRNLAFGVPGAHVQLAGTYNSDSDVIDFQGALRLQAKVSQTMSGWKRWALKPVDPFFAKRGAGTFLPIQVKGNSQHPKFGLRRD